MQFIVFAGLPGTGKSSIAEAVGRELGIPVFAKDWLEATLRRSGLASAEVGYAGYELLTTLAQRQLQLGQSVILDSVASIEAIRTRWRELAETYQAKWCVIECVCSDEAAHRARLAVRERGIPGWHELTWDDVERVKSYFAAWQDERLIIDAVNPLAENIAIVLSYVCQSA
ncbi:MAG: ATP-binding protein [Chloroflexi bacterium]|nr:ATP-binding protein [Chloroflexota bacterium]